MDLKILAAAFEAFADHLRDRPPTRSVTITSTSYDPTFGAREETLEVELIDPDKLNQEIDAFAERLRDGEVELQ